MIVVGSWEAAGSAHRPPRKAMSAAVGAVVVGVSIWLAAHAVAADEFARGLSAYNAADYRTAFDAWYPLADENDPKAQAAIAFL